MRETRITLVLAACLTALATIVLGACSPGEPVQKTAVNKSAESTRDPLNPAVIKELYLRSCHSCHGSGVNGAPRAGDSVAWAPRLAKGMDTLVVNSMNGYRAMPPRGLCFDCTEAQFAGLIRYMAGEQSGPE
ncbi:Cytochrome c5 [Microbulbifer donghaiensis]|uniref:Cytochrome c5 n=1 Tax=Microbulbifer donghaiensis TaxID=494016 RepID=A0A1M5H4J4_9GAMM|nr:c-type cytochrome [Microbulbifer donghaiensis]SHG10917.1 Cytochrome c5 [Microbulbifer donghaiensis]